MQLGFNSAKSGVSQESVFVFTTEFQGGLAESQTHHQIFVSHVGHGLRHLPGRHTVPDARRQGVMTEGVSAIRRREEPPQATQQA